MTVWQNMSIDVPWGQDVFPRLGRIEAEEVLVAGFHQKPVLSADDRQAVLQQARQIARMARDAGGHFSAEQIMAIYKLSTAEGRMIMELAEALLRVPDATTRDMLIFDKLAPGHWLNGDAKGFLLGMEAALEMASGVVRGRYEKGLKAVVARLGVPGVRRAIETAMRQMGGQFVFAETIQQAVKKAARAPMMFSFDMLGEAARSEEDCARYFAAYAEAIEQVGATARHDDVHRNNGVSVKLSALSCRFEARYWPKSHGALIHRVADLAIRARRYNIPLTIDAEEAGRLKPTLHVLERLLENPALQGWSGLGIVVQAYARHAGAVIDWLELQARKHGLRLPIRLVKGAYWDTEIKIAQEKGLEDFPVLTSKTHTDLAYLAHAARLLRSSACFHPQFASHNAYTLAAVVHLAEVIKPVSYEIQKLHGMGDAVHKEIRHLSSAPLRVYAPVGRHHDLLAYLVRRILENGASSSFMNQLADRRVDVPDLVRDPYGERPKAGAVPLTGDRIFAPARKNSRGFDIEDTETLRSFAETAARDGLPPRPADARPEDVAAAFGKARASLWRTQIPVERARVLDQIADHYEQHADALFHLLVHEAGKTIDDAAGELREAVDFCRYYAAQTRQLGAGARARGTVVAISPWNFPLAIFTGQIAAALGAGNTVLAKPAEQTPRIAAKAVALMHAAGVPEDGLQLLPGGGADVGAALTEAGEADMVVFTGSTATAKIIEKAVANSARPQAPLLAETGGLNAMIVDSSALLERVVDDVLGSAFRSAGQRCSALRILYMQEDIAPLLLPMLSYAAAMLKLGSAAGIDTDIGPVIDEEAKTRIDNHVDRARAEGRLIWQGQPLGDGCFCPPAIIRVNSIADLGEEIFGPVLHVATFKAGDEALVVDAINATGYGLTFGMHSRIDASIEAVSAAIDVGNVYINRNQIGAVVGSQPFGGHGLSGTGPKAGGPAYLGAFMATPEPAASHAHERALLPGPSGESNIYSLQPRGHVLVLHPDEKIRNDLAAAALGYGNTVKEAASLPASLDDIDAVMTAATGQIDLHALRSALHQARQQIIPLITDEGGHAWLRREKHICRDLTASGGNIDLLMKQG